MSKQVIHVGYPEPTRAVTVTDEFGNDLTADTVALGLSTSKISAPSVWLSPETATLTSVNVLNDSWIVSKQIDFTTTNPAVGTYYVWAKITTSPSTPVRYTGLQLDIAS